MRWILVFVLLFPLFGCGSVKTSSDRVVKKAQEYCSLEKTVYVCAHNIRVVSSVPGSGLVYYRADGTSFACPLVAPGYESEECQGIQNEKCEEVCASK